METLNKMKKITLNDLKAKPFKLELQHPITKEALGVFVEIVGKNSKRFKDKFYDIVQETQVKSKEERTQVERMRIAEKQSIELVAACIVGWEDEEFFGGPFSLDRALEIVADPELTWVKDQIDAAIVEESHFFTQ